MKKWIKRIFFATLIFLAIAIVILLPAAIRYYHFHSIRQAIEASNTALARDQIDRLPASFDLNWTLWDNIRWVPKIGIIYHHLAGCLSCNADGFPLLWHASRAGDTESMGALISNGASVNYKGDSGSEMLRAATISRNTNAINILIKAGADLKDTFYIRETPLHMAIFDNTSTRIIDFLLHSGANVNALDWRGRTPLDYAYTWNTNAVSILISHGAVLGTSDWLKITGKAQHAPPAGRGEAPRP